MAQLIVLDFMLNDPEYSNPVIEQIQKYPKFVRIAETAWVAETNQECDEVRDHLKEFFYGDGRIVVADLAGLIAWSNIECGNDDLIQILRPEGSGDMPETEEPVAEKEAGNEEVS